MSPAPPRARLLHPLAWWAWAACLAVAATRTTNPFLLALLIAVAAWTVDQRHEPGSRRLFAAFCGMGALAVALRVAATALLGGARMGGHLVLELPSATMPTWLGGLRPGGPVYAEPLLTALYGGLQLAAVLVAVGAANCLAGPRRLLRYIPATLYDAGTAVVVGLSSAPRLVTEATRLARARRLRGHPGRGAREAARLTVPVLASALDGALSLAASMEVRGYGRGTGDARAQRRSSAVAVVGLAGVVVGVYALMDDAAGWRVGLALLSLGSLVAAATLFLGAGRDPRSHYRRDPFAGPERLLLATGVLAAAVCAAWAAVDPAAMAPTGAPLAVPELPLPPVLALVAAGLPGALTPLPPTTVPDPDRQREETEAGGEPAPADPTPHVLAPALVRGTARAGAPVGARLARPDVGHALRGCP